MAATHFDPYATLGIPARASREEAGRAHRRLAKEFHPDVNPGPAAAERMRRINEAWRIVSDPTGRARYDAGRHPVPWPASGYGTGHSRPASNATWTTWPESRGSATSRIRRPTPLPVEPSFGDRPAVLVGVTVILGLLYLVGAWLGSLAP